MANQEQTDRSATLPRTRRRLGARIGLRTLLVVMTVLCVWMGLTANRAIRQRRAVATLEKHRAQIWYDYQNLPAPGASPISRRWDLNATPPKADWLSTQIGEEYFVRPLAVTLRSNNLSADECVRCLADLSDLEELKLLSVRLGNDDAQRLGALRRLKVLMLNSFALVGDKPIVDFDFLDHMPRLVHFSVKSSPGYATFDDQDLVNVTGLRRLTWLQLDGAGVTDAGLAKISAMKQLELINIEGTLITDAGLVHLTKMPNLRYLILNNTAITDAGLLTLGQIPSLAQLHVTGTKTSNWGHEKLQKMRPGCMIEPRLW